MVLEDDGTAAISAEAQIDETVDVFLKNIRMENKWTTEDKQ